MMKRLHLTALMTTALLASTLEPTAWLDHFSAAAPASAAVTAAPLPSVSAPPPGVELAAASDAVLHTTETPPAAQERIEELTDEEIIEMLYARLSDRHTGLSDRERRQVAVTILTEARRHELEPELVIAVIEVESAGYALAVSHVGARGLMQLMPATGHEVARKLDIPWNGNDTLFDPVTNVRLGTAYLRQLANYYGNVTVALAAYNWGPGAIDRRINRGQTVPEIYIHQVMRAYDRGAERRIASRSS